MRLAVTIAPVEVVEVARKLCTVPIVRSVSEKEKVNGVQVVLVAGDLVGICIVGCSDVVTTLGLFEGKRKGLEEPCGLNGALLGRSKGTWLGDAVTNKGATLGLLEGTRKGLEELCGLKGALLGRSEGTWLGLSLTGLLVGETTEGADVGIFVKSPVQLM